MKFSKSYEPDQYEPDIYALWESSNAFSPATGQGNATPYTIVMPPPNANGNLHIGHGLTIALEDILIRYHRLKGDRAWYIPGADHAGFETWVVYEKQLETARANSKAEKERKEKEAKEAKEHKEIKSSSTVDSFESHVLFIFMIILFRFPNVLALQVLF